MKKADTSSRRPKESLFVLVLGTLTLLGLGISGIVILKEEWKNGQALTLAVLFGDGVPVLKSNSPGAYWANMGWQLLGATSVIALSVWNIFALIARIKLRR